MEIYLPAKFRCDISIHGWDKTTSGFGKRTSAILEFYFRFRFWRMESHRHVILHLSAKFRSNQSISGGVMTLYLFFRWPPAAILDLTAVMLDHPRSAIAGLSLVLKFGLNPIYTFGDIAIFIFCRFSLKLPIHSNFWGFFGDISSPNIVTHCSNPQNDHPCAETRRFSCKAWKSVQRPGRKIEIKKVKTGQDNQKSSNISPIWERSPQCTDWDWNVHGG